MRVFSVEQIDVERLLANWRWLCPWTVTLLARNVFADLFLCDQGGRVFRLEVGSGKLTQIADSETAFRERANTADKREEWFAESDEHAARSRGLNLNDMQCIGFSPPLVFAESSSAKPYVGDLYEYVAFLGDLHRQMAELPEGAKVRLQIEP